ncbi:hypothetical protein [Kitasatospora viridis]|uniref:Uncharacterized protein n=1 Tax=Kitasatospora viridis TaxID=281105 RepID=A0A561TTW9_9ACTN|nr:hypothetical protein [Kitasatospora viridis]TWF90579.1 hypothetical protein FHX73_13627 [Kitasatospora viridis]
MIEMHTVLEVYEPDGFTFWPVAAVDRYGYLRLHGGMTPAEVGLAVQRIADYNDVDQEMDQPRETVAALLEGLFTVDAQVVPGGLRVVDTSTGVTVQPGCCAGVEEWRCWRNVTADRSGPDLGHDPSPLAELRGGLVRLTADCEEPGSPFIELPVEEWEQGVDGIERDLRAFLRLAAAWAAETVPAHAELLGTILAAALELSGPSS